MNRGRIAICIGVAAASLAWRAAATPVSVAVSTPAGTPVDEAVVVLDPLDAAAPTTVNKAVIDQVNKRFVPRVSVVRTGTAITFPNSDHIRHQVYSFSPAKTFTLKLYAGTPPTEVVFDHPGLVVLGCNIHDKMVGFVAVVDTPYFATTPASGLITLELPPGRYRLRVWHPSAAAGVASQEIKVGAEAMKIPVVMAVSEGAETAPWPN